MTEPKTTLTRSSFPVLTPVTLRFSDQDPLGHINNVATTALLESGRTGLMRVLFKGFDLKPGSTVLANLTVDYRREILYPDTVDVAAKLVAVGTKSFRAEFGIFQGEICCVTSHSTNVFFDASTRRSREPAPQVRDQLLRILAEHSA